MSASVNAPLFAKYFNNAKVFHVSGNLFPVSEYFLEDVIEMTRFTLKRGKVQENSDEWVAQKQYIKELPAKYSENTYQTLYDLDENEINFDIIEDTVYTLAHKGDLDGSILLFMPGLLEIVTVKERLKKALPGNKFWVLPLHSSLSTAEQQKVFQRPPTGVTKIIISTSIFLFIENTIIN